MAGLPRDDEEHLRRARERRLWRNANLVMLVVVVTLGAIGCAALLLSADRSPPERPRPSTTAPQR